MSQQPPPPGPAAPLEALPLIGVGGAATFVWFQDVCAAILRATPTYSAVEQIGVVGDDQEGLDIRATFEQRDPWGFQCKQEAQFGPADVTKAITEVPVDPSYRATQCRILLARNATAGARARARETAGWDIIDAADLNEMIRALPLDTKVELVRRFWGAVWVERALGVARTATFATSERFYAPFLNHDLTLHHDRPLHGRANDLAQMTTWVGGTAKALMMTRVET